MVCGRRYSPGEVAYVCSEEGAEGVLDARYDYAAASPAFQADELAGGSADMWRYRALLPLAESDPTPPLAVGMTPLYASPRLAKLAGVAGVLLKDDSRQPTGSFKDRASALAVALAMKAGAKAVTTASTGNAAAALAGMAASVGMPCVIFVPASAPKAKITQLLAFGARVVLVRGSYDQAFDLCLAASERTGWYNRNTAFNPFMTEGKKTVAFEIWEQCGRTVPDVVAVSVGDGCIIGALGKGFRELRAMGLIDRLPRLVGVQAEGSDYMTRAFESGADPLTMGPITASTVADSLSAGLPRDRLKAMLAARESGGVFLRVSDAEILAAIPELAAHSGVFAEPAAAAAWAGLRRAARQGIVRPEETACVLVTGTGLKDVDAAARGCAEAGLAAMEIDPAPAALDASLTTLNRLIR